MCWNFLYFFDIKGRSKRTEIFHLLFIVMKLRTVLQPPLFVLDQKKLHLMCGYGRQIREKF